MFRGVVKYQLRYLSAGAKYPRRDSGLNQVGGGGVRRVEGRDSRGDRARGVRGGKGKLFFLGNSAGSRLPHDAKRRTRDKG